MAMPRRTVPESEWTHGEPVTYGRGCRCDPCRVAHNKRKSLLRRQRRESGYDPRWRHGTPQSYDHGCRCDYCRRANTTLEKNRLKGKLQEALDSGAPHNVGMYKLGCRCDKCKLDAADVAREQKYGVSRAAFDSQWLRQGSVCAICAGTPRKPVIDHDHSTGEVRGIICNSCNTALGKFKDDINILLAAIRYLQDPPGIAVE